MRGDIGDRVLLLIWNGVIIGGKGVGVSVLWWIGICFIVIVWGRKGVYV